MIVDIGFWQLLSAYLFIVVMLLIVRLRGISREQEIVIASLRMTFQLVLVGYVLSYIFEHQSVWFTLLFLGLMLGFAVINIYRRVRVNLSVRLRRLIAISLISGTLISLLYFVLVVLSLKPWYNARYFIPIAGMIVGNSMTGVALGANTLVEGIQKQFSHIEGALMLGATPKEAVKEIVNSAFDSAILPTVNSMVGMGIVFLPGMMTGQILSGVSPLTAIQYQIAIMLGIAGSVSLTVISFLYYGSLTFFNDRSQFITNPSSLEK